MNTTEETEQIIDRMINPKSNSFQIADGQRLVELMGPQEEVSTNRYLIISSEGNLEIRSLRGSNEEYWELSKGSKMPGHVMSLTKVNEICSEGRRDAIEPRFMHHTHRKEKLANQPAARP